MKEFGAKLTLNDGMSKSLRNAAKIARDFSKQVQQTGQAVQKFGKARGVASVGVTDRATQTISRVNDAIESIGNEQIMTRVGVYDAATAEVRELMEKLIALKKMAVSPVIRLKDNVTARADKVKRRLKDLATSYTPIVRIRDMATQGMAKIKNTLAGFKDKLFQAVISVKDNAGAKISEISSKLKVVGSAVAKPLVAIRDGASKVLGSISKKLAGLAKKTVIGVTISGLAGIGKSLAEGAKLQQSIGGVETLFKDSAATVKKNADKAFKTAGISANEYMEQVTSFSASLLQSLGGDTSKAANISNMAIIDMADNANKFGTDMESIQNAYQGFAKQNYTMLDNLKLGYGGTKSEMSRLLTDATKLTGVKYNIDSLSDVYSAIHAVQENLKVAGTTAKEASETFSGSFAAMKSAANNLLGNLSVGGDIKGSMKNLVQTASTFLIGNAIPMLGNIFTALPDAIKTAVETSAPKLKGAGLSIVKGLKDSVVALLPSSMGNAVNGIFDSLGATITKVTPMIENILGTVTGMVSGMMPVISDLGSAIVGQLPNILGISQACWQATAPVINSIIPVITAMIPTVSQVLSVCFNIIQTALPVVGNLISTVITAVTPILSTIFSLIQTALPVITQIIQVIASVIQSVVPVIGAIIQSVVPPIQQVLEALSPVIQMIGKVVQMVAPVIGSLVRAAGNIIMAILPAVGVVFQNVANVISSMISVIMSVLQGLYNFLSPIFGAIQSILGVLADVFGTVFGTIADVVSKAVGVISSVISSVMGVIQGFVDKIGSALSAVGDFISKGANAVGGALGFAYGKDRVPYDKYPAILHQGEKVLTRNQADQYDRVMSSRGVQISNTGDGGAVNSGGSVGVSPVSKDTQPQGHNFNITLSPTINISEAKLDSDKNTRATAESLLDDMVDLLVKKMEKVSYNIS